MNLLKNKWSLVLFGILIIFSLLVTQCKNKRDWRYEVHGWVMYKGQPHKAIWKTDTIEVGENYLRYENTDGTEVVIPAPYVLIDYQYDKVIKDTTSAF